MTYFLFKLLLNIYTIPRRYYVNITWCGVAWLEACQLALMGQQCEMVFWPKLSLRVQRERSQKHFLFGPTISELGSNLSHLAHQEKALNVFKRLLLQRRTKFYLRGRPKIFVVKYSLKDVINGFVSIFLNIGLYRLQEFL